MENAETYVVLTELFRRLFRDDKIVLRSETTASDVEGWDSIKHVEILLAAQQRFGFKLRGREIDAITCVGDLANVIERRRLQRPPIDTG